MIASNKIMILNKLKNCFILFFNEKLNKSIKI